MTESDRVDMGLSIPYSRFLESPLINLQCTASSRVFKIHEALLQSKGGSIFSSFSADFKEKGEGLYTFKDTTEGTLLRYMEWAYCDDYPDVLHGTAERSGELSSQRQGEADMNHPLLCHARVYIFANVYLIADLKTLSFTKITRYLKEMGKLRDIDSQLAVIHMLDLAFSNLLPSDNLLHWLGMYAVWCLEYLRMQPSFHDIASKLASFIVRYAQPSSTAPWDSRAHASAVPRYEPGQSHPYEDRWFADSDAGE